MKSFKSYLSEVWMNSISKSSKEASVTSNQKYNHPTDFKKDSHKVGTVGPLEIHASEHNGGMTHFTWHPKDRTIHHVVHAVEAKKTDEGKTRLKYLSAHSREGSPVKMGEVYSHLVKHHDREFVATGHSPGAKKMWDKFHNDSGLEIHGHHPDTGETKKLGPSDKKYAEKDSKDPEEKKTGRMNLILKKAT